MTTPEIKSRIKAELINREINPRPATINEVYHNYMVSNCGDDVDLQDAFDVTFEESTP